MRIFTHKQTTAELVPCSEDNFQLPQPGTRESCGQASVAVLQSPLQGRPLGRGSPSPPVPAAAGIHWDAAAAAWSAEARGWEAAVTNSPAPEAVLHFHYESD
jgi:hypothetical protein